MKSILIVLLGLAALIAGQPVGEAVPVGIPVGNVAVEAEPIHDMEGSEAGLKLINHKLDHWLHKCHKKGGCGSGYGYGGYPGYGYPVAAHPPHFHSAYAVPVPVAVPVPYPVHHGGAHSLYGGHGGYGYGGYGYGHGHGGLGGYGYGR